VESLVGKHISVSYILFLTQPSLRLQGVVTETVMSTRKFQVGALTAALQNAVDAPNPRAYFLEDPIGAANESALNWLDWIKEMGGDGIELAAALPLPDSYIDPATLLDPVAAHLPVRTATDGSGTDLTQEFAEALISRASQNGVKIWSLGVFENPLHHDQRIREQIHQHILRCARAAKLLAPAGCTAVSCFVGRDATRDLDDNLGLVEERLVPLWHEMRNLGVNFQIENCPMPGWWDAPEQFIKNLASTPDGMIRVLQIASRNGCKNVGLTYDASHDVLQGARPEATIGLLDEANFSDRVFATHGKDMHRDSERIERFGGHGQRFGLKDHPEGGWGAMVGEHGMPGLCPYDPGRLYRGDSVDFVDLALALLNSGRDLTTMPQIIEHEWTWMRVQDPAKIIRMYQLSIRWYRAALEMATCHFESFLDNFAEMAERSRAQ